MNTEKLFNNKAKGIGLIAVGAILFLYQFGLLPQNLCFYVMIALSLYLIFLGLIKVDGIQRIQNFFKKD